MRHEYPHPGNEDELEEFCVRFFRHVERRAGLIRYGKRGEAQHGIDIIDQRAVSPHIVIQCKRHEQGKTIPPADIKAEVAAAERSGHKIDRYIIATTARKSKHAQNAVIALNQRSSNEKQFVVEILFWEDICAMLSELGRAVADGLVYCEPRVAEPSEPERSEQQQHIPVAGESFGRLNDYDEVESLFEQRKIEAAEHALSKLPDPEVTTAISEEHRYALLRLRGKLAIEREDYAEAARLFVSAFQAQPENPQAQQNQVLALELQGNRSAAFDAAEALCHSGNDSVIATSALVRNAPSRAALTKHWQRVLAHAETSEDVSVAIVHAALGWSDLELAESVAEKAVREYPQSAHAWFARACVDHHQSIAGPLKSRVSKAESAIKCYNRAEGAARSSKLSAILPEILSNRARVHASRSRVALAARDYQDAIASAIHPSAYAEDAVRHFLSVDDYQSAKTYVELIDVPSQHKDFFAAVVSRHLGEPKAATATMQQIGLSTSPYADDACCFAVQWALQDKDKAQARDCVTDSVEKRSPLLAWTLRAWIEEEDAENVGDVAMYIRNALEAPAENVGIQVLDALARLLCRLHRCDEAIPFFERAYKPGVLDHVCKGLLVAAQEADRDDILLRVCTELHDSQQIDEQLMRVHVEVLLQYDPSAARERSIEYMEWDKPFFQAVCNYCSAGLGELHLIRFDVPHPTPVTLSPALGAIVLVPLTCVERYQDALRYAYLMLRQFFSQEHVHGVYLWYFLQHEDKFDFIDSDTASANTAVLLRNTSTGAERWIVPEDDSPDLLKDEYGLDSSSVKSILGKRIGELVPVDRAFPLPSDAEETEEIATIQDKHIYRFRDVISNYTKRFQGTSALRRFDIGSDDTFDPTPLLEVTKARRESIDNALDYYRTNLCSLHLLANRLGLDIRRVIEALSTSDEDVIRCTNPTHENFEEAIHACQKKRSLVVDLSGLVTATRLGLWEHWSGRVDVVVTHATKNCVDLWVEEARHRLRSEFATLHASNDDQVYVNEQSEDEKYKELKDVQRIADAIENQCQVVGATAAASIDRQRREVYAKVIGLPALFSICVAQERGAVLWTDDVIVAMVGLSDFGVERVWSQAVCQLLVDDGQLTYDDMSSMTSHLLEWGYVSTRWRAHDLIAAAIRSEWDTQAPAFRRTFLHLGDSKVQIGIRMQITVEFLKLLRQSSCSPIMHTAIIQAVLDALGNVPATKFLLQRLEEAFAPDLAWAAFLDDQVSYWLRHRG
ncbi:PIN domain-containing protein [Aeoliella sp. SH292]|uniref:PIN domain-containing protein n=1 Tax=Aeoliella sp. SH292 TaxID=3454464 RepID=UPI003F9763C5